MADALETADGQGRWGPFQGAAAARHGLWKPELRVLQDESQIQISYVKF